MLKFLLKIWNTISSVFKFQRNKIVEEYTTEDTKESATAKKLPWVTINKVHIDPENPRNGFMELDWNEYFILSLKEHGYSGKTEEEIVDQWFTDLVNEVGSDENIPMDRRNSGYIDITHLTNGKNEKK